MSKRFFYGYRIVVAGSVIQMMHLGCVFTFGVLFPEFESEFGWSRALISGATSLNFLLLGIFGVLMGLATDRLWTPHCVNSLWRPVYGWISHDEPDDGNLGAISRIMDLLLVLVWPPMTSRH